MLHELYRFDQDVKNAFDDFAFSRGKSRKEYVGKTYSTDDWCMM